MNIVLGHEVAEALKENYTVLELDTFESNGQPVTAFCVVNEIPLPELPQLEQNKQLHAEFMSQYYQGNYGNCEVIAHGLMGKFNGELDSFYETLMDRVNSTLK